MKFKAKVIKFLIYKQLILKSIPLSLFYLMVFITQIINLLLTIKINQHIFSHDIKM